MNEKHPFLLFNKVGNLGNKLKSASSWVLTLAFFSFLFAGSLYAQQGETCDDPIVIYEFPFNESGHTANYGNHYAPGDVPPTADNAVTNGTGGTYYITSFDVVYSFTPAEEGTVDISLTNDNGATSLWVFTGCPFSSTVGYHTALSGSSRAIEGLPVVADETYYIVISDWDNAISYTLDVTGNISLEGLDACEGDVEAGTVIGDDMACPDVVFSLTAEGSTTGFSGLNRQWQSSLDGEN